MSTPRKLRVLIACECSGAVREAFRRRGHDAWSCDLKDSEDGSPHHIRGDCFAVAEAGCPTDGKAWDMIIWHPPCTDIAVSSNAHLKAKKADGRQKAGISFFMRCVNFPVERSVVENPVCIMSTVYREPDQIIQPWEFGEDASKKTCLWLRGVPPLLKSHGDNDLFLRPVDAGRRTPDGKRRFANQTDSGQNKLAPSPTRAADRARTYHGIAEAMAEQWGG